MKTILIGCVLVALIFSCDQKSPVQEQELYNPDSKNLLINDTLIEPQLYKLGEEYIKEYNSKIPFNDWAYFNHFFFKEGENLFVTIWLSTVFPNVYLHEKESDMVYYSLYYIRKRKVIYIINNHDSLFRVTPESIKAAKNEDEKMYEGPDFDGDHYFKTYLIIESENGFQFKKLEKAKVSFLESKPPDSYLH